MFGRDMSGLKDDIANLQNEASEVLRAIERLDQKIYEGINDYQLKNGSHVKTTMLDKLNTSQHQRVLANFAGRFYEHVSTHHQYRIILDQHDSQLAVVSAEMSPKHTCIHRSE